jgi:tetratricopeptide (TPR) repeat protein
MMLMRSLLRIAALIAAAIGIYQLCVEPYRGNLIIDEVARRSVAAQSASGLDKTALVNANLRQLDGAEESRRLDPNWYLLYGANCELLERWHDALIVYTRALQIDHRPEIYEARGLVEQQLGLMNEAEADLVTAARFNPGMLRDLDDAIRPRVEAALPREK